jgi:hypothetical protein
LADFYTCKLAEQRGAYSPSWRFAGLLMKATWTLCGMCASCRRRGKQTLLHRKTPLCGGLQSLATWTLCGTCASCTSAGACFPRRKATAPCVLRQGEGTCPWCGTCVSCRRHEAFCLAPTTTAPCGGQPRRPPRRGGVLVRAARGKGRGSRHQQPVGGAPSRGPWPLCRVKVCVRAAHRGSLGSDEITVSTA